MEENLMNKVEKVEKKIDMILDFIIKQTSSLTTYSSVAAYLNVTSRTIRNYVLKGHFKEDEHFYINHNNRTIFIPKAIIAFKENSNVAKISMNKETKIVTPKVIHPTASRILKSMAS